MSESGSANQKVADQVRFGTQVPTGMVSVYEPTPLTDKIAVVLDRHRAKEAYFTGAAKYEMILCQMADKRHFASPVQKSSLSAN